MPNSIRITIVRVICGRSAVHSRLAHSGKGHPQLCQPRRGPSYDFKRGGMMRFFVDTYRIQFSTFSPLTRRNSRRLSLTSTMPRVRACAAMRRSLAPIGFPVASSVTRIFA